MLAAANVNYKLAVGRNRNTRQLLPVIHSVVCKFTRAKVRSFRNPDVALSLLIECPRDARAGSGGGQFVRERVALHLLDCKLIGLRDGDDGCGEDDRDGDECAARPCEWHKSFDLSV